MVKNTIAYSFWFHYNKPESTKTGIPTLTLHYKGACHMVTELVCEVPVQSKVRTRHPRMVIAGKAESVTIKDGKAVIK